MAEPDNMILALLRELRAEMSGVRQEVKAGFGEVNTRFERLEKKIESVKQAAFGESVLGRYAVAEVEERFEAIEKRLASLERR